MKILFLTHYFPPEGNAPASRVSSMCGRWAAAGHEVTVVTCVPNVPDGIPYQGYRNRWLQEEQLDGVRVVRVWTWLAANRGSLGRILNYMSFCLTSAWRAWRLPKCDLVIATSPQFFCGWAGVWAARAKRRPLVLEIRDIWPESIDAVGALGSGGWIRSTAMRYLAWLERRMYAAATKIVTVGDGYQQKLLERGVPAERIAVITNGVEDALFWPRPADARLRAQAGATETDFLVGYVGTVGMAHGLEVLVDAARLARDRGLQRLRFVVVGDGACLSDLRSQVEGDDSLPLTFIGRRPKQEMPNWLASLDACCIHLRDKPTFRTVLPSKIFEAAATSRPILLGVRGEAQRIVDRLACGVAFEPESAEGLVAAAQELMAKPERAAALGDEGRRRVVDQFGLDGLASRYLDLLLETAGAGGEGDIALEVESERAPEIEHAETLQPAARRAG
ncbi:MAG: glycosyltransferase involved in cell wall biosynthesis [Planctomycetota bacterium]|jgi:glycosyltransferase involved in cell wall biosynthesis